MENGIGQGNGGAEHGVESACQQDENGGAEKHIPDGFKYARAGKYTKQHDDGQRNGDGVYASEYAAEGFRRQSITELSECDGGRDLQIDGESKQDDGAEDDAKENCQCFHDPTILGNGVSGVKVKWLCRVLFIACVWAETQKPACIGGFLRLFLAAVAPAGIEPTSKVPETFVLSIERRGR